MCVPEGHSALHLDRCTRGREVSFCPLACRLFTLLCGGNTPDTILTVRSEAEAKTAGQNHRRSLGTGHFEGPCASLKQPPVASF